jgi:hypothetical protein
VLVNRNRSSANLALASALNVSGGWRFCSRHLANHIQGYLLLTTWSEDSLRWGYKGWAPDRSLGTQLQNYSLLMPVSKTGQCGRCVCKIANGLREQKNPESRRGLCLWSLGLRSACSQRRRVGAKGVARGIGGQVLTIVDDAI